MESTFPTWIYVAMLLLCYAIQSFFSVIFQLFSLSLSFLVNFRFFSAANDSKNAARTVVTDRPLSRRPHSYLCVNSIDSSSAKKKTRSDWEKSQANELCMSIWKWRLLGALWLYYFFSLWFFFLCRVHVKVIVSYMGSCLVWWAAVDISPASHSSQLNAGAKGFHAGKSCEPQTNWRDARELKGRARAFQEKKVTT